jgi:hypothetical protein
MRTCKEITELVTEYLGQEPLLRFEGWNQARGS